MRWRKKKERDENLKEATKRGKDVGRKEAAAMVWIYNWDLGAEAGSHGPWTMDHEWAVAGDRGQRLNAGTGGD